MLTCTGPSDISALLITEMRVTTGRALTTMADSVGGWESVVPRIAERGPQVRVQQERRHWCALEKDATRLSRVFACFQRRPRVLAVCRRPRSPGTTWTAAARAGEAQLRRHTERGALDAAETPDPTQAPLWALR